jgi:hypothetical protein
MTDEERQLMQQVREAIPAAREEAARYGSMHAYWDLIFDFEAIESGRPTLAQGTRMEVLQYIAKHLVKPRSAGCREISARTPP